MPKELNPTPPEGFKLDAPIPPEGFTLDQPVPPKGFVLDGVEPAAVETSKPTLTEFAASLATQLGELQEKAEWKLAPLMSGVEFGPEIPVPEGFKLDPPKESLVDAAGKGLARSWLEALNRRDFTEAKKGYVIADSLEKSMRERGATDEDINNPDVIGPASIRERQRSRIERIQDRSKTLEFLKPSETTQAALRAESFKEGINAVMEDPVRFITEVGTGSAVQSAEALGPALAGGLFLGIPGAMLGAGWGSYTVDQQASFMEALNGAGVDLSDPEAVEKALSNKKTLNEAEQYAHRHGLPVAVFDAVSLGIAGKTLSPAFKSLLARGVTNVVNQAAVQASLGAAGEATGQLFSEGRISSPGEVLAEFGGELVTFPGDVATAVLSRRRGEYYAKIEGYIKDFGGSIQALIDNRHRLKPEEQTKLAQYLIDDIITNTEADISERMNQLKSVLLGDEATLYNNAFGPGTLGDTIDPYARVDTVDHYAGWVSDNHTQEIYNTWRDDEGRGYFDLAPGEVAVSIGKVERNVIEMTAAQIRRLEEVVNSNPDAPQSVKNDLKQKRKRLGRERSRLARKKAIGRSLQGVLQEWANAFLPGRKFLLDLDGSIASDIMGRPWESVYGFLAPLESGDFVLRVDPEMFRSLGNKRIATQLDKREGKNLTEADIIARRSEEFDMHAMIDTLAHEFGHALQIELIEKAPEDIKNALYRLYAMDMAMWDKADGVKFMKTREARFMADEKFKRTRLKDGKFGWGYTTEGYAPGDIADRFSSRHYYLSFDEWWAEKIARNLQATKRGGSAVDRYISRVANVFKRFISRFGAQFYTNTDRKLQDYLEAVAGQVTLDRLQKTRAEMQKEEVAKKVQSDPVLMASEVMDSLGVNKETKSTLRTDADRYNKFIEWTGTLLQLGNLNPHIEGLQKYIERVRNWWIDKSLWTSRADRRLKEILGRISKDQRQRLSRFALDVTEESDRLGRRLTEAELAEINNRRHNRLDERTMEIWGKMDQDFVDAVKEMKEILIAEAQQTFFQQPSVLQSELKRLNEEFEKLEDRNYFPYSRFGQYTLKVTTDKVRQINGRTFKPGETVYFELYESQRERDRAADKFKKEYNRPGEVTTSYLDETTAAFAGMPQVVIHALKRKLVDSQGNSLLTEAQLQQLNEIAYELSPSRSYLKHMLNRSGTWGFSYDVPRAYANYFMRFSNHVARLKHGTALQEAIDGVVESARRSIYDSTKRMKIAHHMAKHKEYIFNPGNEWAHIRAIGFLWYLGYNIKSAYVNLTQVPLVGWPYLAARKELYKRNTIVGVRDAIAAKEISAAYKDIASILRGRIKLGKANLTDSEQEMLAELNREGIINESQATDLAGVAEGSNLQRFLPGSGSGPVARTTRKIAAGGAFFFHVAEEYNRRVMALAAYRLAKNAGMDHDTAVREARESIEKTQFEYARWNRPELFQGKRSAVFLFMNYMQNMLYFAFNDPGAIRYWILLTFAAGLTGLPGADDLLDVVKALVNKYKRELGENDYWDPRQELRAVIHEFGANPDLVMHGLGSKYGLGPFHLMELGGIPVPNVDITGSLSMGRVMPGVEPAMALANPGVDPNRQLSQVSTELLGPAYSIPVNMIQGLFADDPREWHNATKMMPTFMANLTKAGHAIATGEVADRSGAEIASFDTENPRELAEAAAWAMGFQPHRMVHEREARWMLREQANYMQARKTALQQQMFQALEKNDREVIADVTKAIKKYNTQVPPAFWISTEGLKNSIRQRLYRNYFTEEFGTDTKKFIPFAQEELERGGWVETEPVR